MRRLSTLLVLSVFMLMAYMYWIDATLLYVLIPFMAGLLAGVSLMALAVVIASIETDRRSRRVERDLKEQSPHVSSSHPTRIIPGVSEADGKTEYKHDRMYH